jgi:hypothetical protein
MGTIDSSGDAGGSVLTPVRVQRASDKVDLLFMIDGSPAMGPMQDAFRNRFQTLLTILLGANGANASYHIGIVDADLGAPGLNASYCTATGDAAQLIALGRVAPSTCMPPKNNQHYIEFNQADGSNNLPAGQDLVTTFGCMAQVGQTGCGFRHSLESVYRALHDPIPVNQGFLRTDAALVVIFLTDKDDCSAPDNTDLYDPAKTPDYGNLASYRCQAFGYLCGNPPALLPKEEPAGPFTNCVPATMAQGGKLIDLDRYTTFFSKPAAQGGVKIDPNDVFLAAITGIPTSYESVFAVPVLSSMPYIQCDPGDGGASQSCYVQTQRVCESTVDQTFLSEPTFRVDRVVRSATHWQETSICATDYTQPLQQLGQTVVGLLAPACLPGPLPDSHNPNCQVKDQTLNPANGMVTETALASCASGAAPPCWKLTPNPACPSLVDGKGQTQQVVLEVDRGNNPPPANTVPTGQCELSIGMGG